MLPNPDKAKLMDDVAALAGRCLCAAPGCVYGFLYLRAFRVHPSRAGIAFFSTPLDRGRGLFRRWTRAPWLLGGFLLGPRGGRPRFLVGCSGLLASYGRERPARRQAVPVEGVPVAPGYPLHRQGPQAGQAEGDDVGARFDDRPACQRNGAPWVQSNVSWLPPRRRGGHAYPALLHVRSWNAEVVRKFTARMMAATMPLWQSAWMISG